MKKDTRFQRKYTSNDKVNYLGKTWTICKDTYQDENNHVYYKVSRGAWKRHVRGDKLVTV